MVYDLWSGYPAQISYMMLLGLTQEEAEELACRANELISAPRPAMLSGYFSSLSMFYWPWPEQSNPVPASTRVADVRSGSGANRSKPRFGEFRRFPVRR